MFRYYFRNKVKFCFSVFTVVISIALFCTLEMFSVLSTYSADESLIIVSNNVSLVKGLPVSYRSRIAQTPGVENVTHFHVAVGKKEEHKPPTIIISVDVDTYFDVVADLTINQEELEVFKKERNACLVGHSLARKNSWQAGDQINLKIPRSKKVFEFVVRGTYKADKKNEENFIFCHYSYHSQLVSTASGRVFNYVVKVKEVRDLPQVAEKIDKHFENSSPATRSEPERVFASNLEATRGNFALIFRFIGIVILIATLLVIINTLTIATQQQIVTLSILKVLGYSQKMIRTLIMLESIFICLLGGVIGCGLPVAFFYYKELGLNWLIITKGMGLALIIGFLAGLIPMFIAGRKRHLGTELRKIA